MQAQQVKAIALPPFHFQDEIIEHHSPYHVHLLHQVDLEDERLFRSHISALLCRSEALKAVLGSQTAIVREAWYAMNDATFEEALTALLLCHLPALQTLICDDLGYDAWVGEKVSQIVKLIVALATSGCCSILGRLEVVHTYSSDPDGLTTFYYCSRWSHLLRLPSLRHFHGQNLELDYPYSVPMPIESGQASVQAITLTTCYAGFDGIQSLISACKALVSFHYTLEEDRSCDREFPNVSNTRPLEDVSTLY